MALGKEHNRMTEITSQFVIIGVMLYTKNINYSILAYFGCLLNLIMDPDLDINTLTLSETKVLNFNKVLGLIWITIWTPYGKIIPHRHFTSHLPILGTVGRYLYLSIWIWFSSLFLTDPSWLLNFLLMYQVELFYMVLGTIVADTVHFLADVL